jgi:succinyl-CoA synthetase alpha subunit
MMQEVMEDLNNEFEFVAIITHEIPIKRVSRLDKQVKLKKELRT